MYATSSPTHLEFMCKFSTFVTTLSIDNSNVKLLVSSKFTHIEISMNVLLKSGKAYSKASPNKVIANFFAKLF